MTLTGILQRIYESAMHAKSYAPSVPVMAYLEAIQRDTQSIAAITQPEFAPADARTQASGVDAGDAAGGGGMNSINWLLSATRFTFAQKPPNQRRTTEDDDIHIEACDQRDGSRLWAVRQGGNCLCTDGGWEFECYPSSRDAGWKLEHRFASKEKALAAMLALEVIDAR